MLPRSFGGRYSSGALWDGRNVLGCLRLQKNRTVLWDQMDPLLSSIMDQSSGLTFLEAVSTGINSEPVSPNDGDMCGICVGDQIWMKAPSRPSSDLDAF